MRVWGYAPRAAPSDAGQSDASIAPPSDLALRGADLAIDVYRQPGTKHFLRSQMKISAARERHSLKDAAPRGPTTGPAVAALARAYGGRLLRYYNRDKVWRTAKHRARSDARAVLDLLLASDQSPRG